MKTDHLPHGLEEAILNAESVALAKKSLEMRGYSPEETERIAKDGLASLRATVNPKVQPWAVRVAKLIAAVGFSGTPHVSGLENVIAALKKGRVGISATHFSYADIPEMFSLFSRQGIENVFYVGGQNVYSVPVVNFLLEPGMRNSGLIPIRRELTETADSEAGSNKEAYFYGILVVNSVAGHLKAGHNVVNYYGTGRYRDGKIPEKNSVVTKGFAEGAQSVVPVRIDYARPPEDTMFALGKGKGKANALQGIIPIIKARLSGDYGQVYITFGEPIPIADDAASRQNPKRAASRLQLAMRDSLVRLGTLTPNSAVGTVLGEGQSFTAEGLCSYVSLLVEKSINAGIRVAPQLEGHGREEAIRRSIEYFAKKGAIISTYNNHYELQDRRLLNYYAETIRETLNRFNVQVQKKISLVQ